MTSIGKTDEPMRSMLTTSRSSAVPVVIVVAYHGPIELLPMYGKDGGSPSEEVVAKNYCAHR